MSSISVYILTYNRADYLKETIQSILSQTYKDFSLYILDNGSEDKTSEVVSSFHDDRLHYIRHSHNIGSYGNSRFAMDHCKTDYYVLFHDDDLMLPDFLQSEMEVMQKDHTIDIVSGNAILFGNANGLIKKAEDAYHLYEGTELFRKYMRQGNFLVFPSIMYRRSFIEEHCIRGKEAAGPSGDIILCFDIERYGGKICEIGKPIMKYRVHEGQDSLLNKYPMHMQLFHFLRADKDYKKIYSEEVKGRKNRYNSFSKQLLKDWANEYLSYEYAQKYYEGLAEELMVHSLTLWYFLFRCCCKWEFPKKILKRVIKLKRS